MGRSIAEELMALTLHYIDPNLVSRNWTLEVEHFLGMHTASSMVELAQAAMDRWGLRAQKCAVLLRDGAANAVSTAQKLKVNHMSCGARSLRLMVAAVTISKKGSVCGGVRWRPHNDESQGQDLDVTEGDDDTPNPDAEAADVRVAESVEASALEGEKAALPSVRVVVAVFRRLAVYFHKFPKAKNKLMKLQERDGVKQPLCAHLGGQGSVLAAQAPAPELQAVVDSAMPADALGYVFATELLSGETVALAIPLLRVMQLELQTFDMVDEIAGSVGDEDGVSSAILMIHTVHAAFVCLLTKWFADLHGDLKWISHLDSRVSVATYLGQDEDAEARRQFP
ncbi:hypothetical protein PybrP1_011026 [[Pythium] brassicae (nom. inval.)]|nr:hypothetical protein PybrP1_011026 [[Pythium] brassicae (nom. inval.)]